MREELGPNVCRVCLEPSNRLQKIYESREEGEETPNEMLTQLLGGSYTKLNDHDHVPDSICKQCKVELNMAFQFREKALRKQLEIEEHFRDLGILDDSETVYVKEENLGDSQMNEIGEFMLDEEAAIAKNAEFVEIIAPDQNETITGDIEYLEENYIEVDPELDEIVLETSDNSENKVIRARPMVTLRANVPARRLRARKNINLQHQGDGEKGGFICDICGNFYEKRGRMMEHRRRHDTELQYQCELCEAKFQVREQLRKHMYSHTGSKPFKCSYCSRQFFYESVLKSHEDVHRGVKPYVCKICDKAFAYAHSLTKHELIHTDVKMYRCHYCNKDFRLLHHMRQHEETKCHQNAVMLAQTMKYNQDEQEVELIGDVDLGDERNENY